MYGIGTPQNVDESTKTLMTIPGNRFADMAPKIIIDYINNRSNTPILGAGDDAAKVNAMYEVVNALVVRGLSPIQRKS